MRGLTGSISSDTKKCAQSLTKSLNQDYNLLALLETCSTEEQFQGVLIQLQNLVSKLSSSNSNQFRLGSNSAMTARKYINLISKISGNKDYWLTSKALLSLRPGFSDKSIKFLSQINLPIAEDIKQCLDIWSQFYGPNIERMKYENSQIGGDKREEAKNKITQHITNTKKQLQSLVEVEK